MSSGKPLHTGFDPCVGCSSKYGRTQSSICQCIHCSKPFCIDCMKEHNDEIREHHAQLVDLRNQVKASINTKRAWITAESTKSKAQLNEWLEKYIGSLKAEKEIIDRKIEEKESEAQKFVLGIEAELQEVTAQIESLTLSTTNRENQQAKLNRLLERLECLKVNKEHNLPSAMPQYTQQFSWLPGWAPIPPPRRDENQPETETKASTVDDTESITSDDSLPDESYFCNRAKFETTSYVVHCMASDGTNIMYTTEKEGSQPARIAYCYLDTADDRCGKTDPSREWLQSGIVDMVYWTSITTFVCATEIGVRTVDHTEGLFRILSTVENRWAGPRIAVNTDFLWVHTGQQIHVYNAAFQLVRTIASPFARSLTRTSFCLTDDYAVFAFDRLLDKGRKVSEVRFYNCDLVRLKTLRLGERDTPPMIRSDGTDRFFVAIGQQRFLIVSPDGKKQTVNLGKQASCLTVVNSRNVVLTRSRSDVECVRC